MLLVLFLWLIVILVIIGIIQGFRRDSEGLQALSIMSSVLLGIPILLTSFIVPLSAQVRVQEMIAFQEVNASNYQATVDRTELILSEQKFISQAFIPIEGSIEKIDVGSLVIDQLIEWREKVVRYNNDLVSYRYFDDHPILGFYYPTPPDYLKTIVIR